ncbi:MAG: hypothetical protein ACREV0_14050 [Burkholderiales bacterium]
MELTSWTKAMILIGCPQRGGSGRPHVIRASNIAVDGERHFSVAVWAAAGAGRLNPCADPAIERPARAVTA